MIVENSEQESVDTTPLISTSSDESQLGRLWNAFWSDLTSMNNKLPVYPKDHLLGMRVPHGGSSCKTCEYVRGQECTNKIFQEWKGDNIIPAPVEDYCCDMYESEDKIGDTKFEDVGL